MMKAFAVIAEYPTTSAANIADNLRTTRFNRFGGKWSVVGPRLPKWVHRPLR
jgi:hypothetical protein